MTIKFCGAAERVTGSNYLVDTGKTKFLVDMGLFQGDHEADKENWQEFLYDAEQIDFVIITHSHIDHIGRLPLLYKRGFRGKIYSTPPTCKFAQIFLEDTVRILAKTAEELKLPMLYDETDVEGVMKLFNPQNYYEEFSPTSDIKIKFYDAGHILGSAITEVNVDKKIIVFSGDLGNPPVPILRDTDFIPEADYVVMESTYGNRTHAPFEKRQLELERVIEETQAKNGVLLIPSFAMERTQEIIYELNELIKNNRIKEIPIYIDSPLATRATEIYRQHPEYFDKEAQGLIKKGEDFLNFANLKFTQSIEESKELDRDNSSKIIIAGSGMSAGGRIIFHEKTYLPLENTTLLIIGFQVKGTLGRKIELGEKTVNIQGEEVNVKAKVQAIESYSAHADKPRLKYWLGRIGKPIKKVFLVHGEPASQDVLLHDIEEEQGIETYIPKYGESVEI